MRLYFDRHADNSPRLCFMEEINPEAEPRTLRSWDYRYGGSDRLEEIREIVANREESVTCYRYDQSGYPSGRVVIRNGSCDKASLQEAEQLFVHDESGRLLRTIYKPPRARYEREEGNNSGGRRIQTFDSQGALKNLYAKTQDGQVFIIPPFIDPERESTVGFVILSDSDRNLTVPLLRKDLADHSAKWRYVRLHERYLGGTDEFREEGIAEVIAEGKTDSSGMASLGELQTKRLIGAVKQYTNAVMLRSPALFAKRIYILQGLPDKQWKACVNPEQRKRSACP